MCFKTVRHNEAAPKHWFKKYVSEMFKNFTKHFSAFAIAFEFLRWACLSKFLNNFSQFLSVKSAININSFHQDITISCSLGALNVYTTSRFPHVKAAGSDHNLFFSFCWSDFWIQPMSLLLKDLATTKQVQLRHGYLSAAILDLLSQVCHEQTQLTFTLMPWREYGVGTK